MGRIGFDVQDRVLHLQVSGGIACLLRASDGRVSLAGPVTADSVLIDGTGLITVNEWTLAVAGDVRLTDAGAVSMDHGLVVMVWMQRRSRLVRGAEGGMSLVPG